MVQNKRLNPSFFKRGLLLQTLHRDGESFYFLKDTSFPPTLYEIKKECVKYILLIDSYGLNIPNFTDADSSDFKATICSLEEERLLARHNEPFVSSGCEIIIEDCDSFVGKIYRLTKPIFTKKGFLFSLLFIACSLWFLVRDPSWFKFSSLSPLQLIVLLLFGIPILIIGTIIHEFLHGLMIKKYGGDVSMMGFCFFPFPSGFCDVSSLHFIEGRIARFSVWAMGIYFWIIITIFFCLLCKVSKQGIFFYLAICGFIATLVVINPFISSDGKEAIREILRKKEVRKKMDKGKTDKKVKKMVKVLRERIALSCSRRPRRRYTPTCAGLRG